MDPDILKIKSVRRTQTTKKEDTKDERERIYLGTQIQTRLAKPPQDNLQPRMSKVPELHHQYYLQARELSD